jgi:TonB-linked SusC/RagA family outer membrane protein
MKLYRRTGSVLLAALLVLGIAAEASAQTAGAVRGRITDEMSGQPIVGVQVSVVGTQRGTITDQNGVYLIPGVPAGQHQVRIQHIGYGSTTRSVTIGAGETVTLDLRLQTAVIDMQEIVVTGVAGEQSRAKLPFTVDRLTAAAMPVAAPTAAGMIAGKVAGASVVTSSGRPGVAPSILLRGPTSINASGRSQEPMYIVDGVILSASIVDIDAMDIESIEIVKGAAAASLYGSRAANGVIQITTQRGRNVANDQVRYTVRTDYGTGQLHGRFNLTQTHQFEMQGNQFVSGTGQPCDWVQCPSVRLAGQRALPGSPANEWNTIMQERWPGQTHDHMKSFFTPGASITNQVTVQGRSGGTNFLVSYNRLDEDGIYRFHRGQLRHTFRMNVDQSMRPDLTLSASASYTRNAYQTSEGGLHGLTRMPAGVDLMAPDPNLPEFFILKPDPFNDNFNPLVDLANTHQLTTRGRFLGSVAARYTPLTWLNVDADVSFDRADLASESWRRNNVPNLNQVLREGFISYSHNRIEGINAALTGTVRRTFGDLNSISMLRYLVEKEDNQAIGVNSSQFIAEGVYTIGNTPSAQRSGSSSTSPERRDGFFVSQQLDFRDRYIVDALVRQDGSSRFGAGERRQWYYRLAGRYRVAEEPWFNVDAIDELGLRYSIGTAGNTPNWSAQYETYSVTESGITPTTLGNRNLKPEYATEVEMGIDVMFLNRFMFDLTHARTDVKDQILNVPSLAYTGFSSQWVNAGRLESNTWESSVTAQFRPRTDLTWTTRLMFDRTRQQITELNRPAYQTGVSGQGLGAVFYVRPGEVLGTFYGRQFATECGHLPADIDCSQFQVNDDGYLVWVGGAGSWQNGWQANPAGGQWWGTQSPWADPTGKNIFWGTPFMAQGIDRVTGEETTFLPLGNTTPDYTLNFSNTLVWRNFTLYGLLSSVQGQSVYNQPLQWAVFQNYAGIMDQSGVADENARKPLGYFSALYNQLSPNSHWVVDGSYVKLREMQLSYRAGRDVLDRVPVLRGFEGLRFSVTGNNLLTWSSYDGYDPDVGSTGGGTGSASLARVDGYSYPPYRTVRFGVEVNF